MNKQERVEKLCFERGAKSYLNELENKIVEIHSKEINVKDPDYDWLYKKKSKLLEEIAIVKGLLQGR